MATVYITSDIIAEIDKDSGSEIDVGMVEDE